MLTLTQINAIHDTLGRADSLAEYLTALRAIGVDTCDSFIADGHSEYRGGGQVVKTPPAHEVLTIAETSDAKAMQKHIERHEKQVIYKCHKVSLKAASKNGHLTRTR